MKSPLLFYAIGAVLFGHHAASQATINTNCPLHGPVFPPPRNPAGTDAVKAFQSSIDGIMAQALASGLDNQTTSFSVQVFSGFDDQVLLDYHFAAPGLNGSLTGGSLNKDTIYRIGSGTKLFTTYAWLATVGFSNFEEPITNYLPELEIFDNKNTKNDDDINQISWRDVTVGSLLSHMSGVARDLSFEDLANYKAMVPDPTIYGLPALNSTEIPSCGVANNLTLCTTSEYFQKLNTWHPTDAPFSRTTYSNIAFGLIGFALEQITGRPFAAAFNKSLAIPLGLHSTSMTLPTNLSNAVIPAGEDDKVMFYLDGGHDDPSSSLYTTPAEMTILLRSILNNTILSARDTRRWMKPLSFTSSNNSFVGAPWEIWRTEIPLTPTSNTTRLLDWYTKLGLIGEYGSFIALNPDHNMGFSVMAAGNYTEPTVLGVSSILSAELQNVFEAAAREVANKTYVGTYASKDKTSNITITMEDDRPGLGVSSWFSNGVDFLESITALSGNSIRLYPSGLGSATTVGFRAVFEALPATLQEGLFNTNCLTWAFVDSLVYGGVGVDEFKFGLANGTAKTVTPRALRSTLTRTD